MRYVYHIYAVSENSDKTVELDGLIVMALPVMTQDLYELLKRNFCDDYGVEEDGSLIIKSLTFLHKIDDEA